MKFETDSKEFRIILDIILSDLKHGVTRLSRIDSILEFNKEQRGCIIDLADDLLDFLKRAPKEGNLLTMNINKVISSYMKLMVGLLLSESYDHEEALKIFKNQILLIRESKNLKVEQQTKSSSDELEPAILSFFDLVKEEYDFEGFESIIEENMDIFLLPRSQFLPASKELELQPSLQTNLPFSLRFLQKNHQYLTFNYIGRNKSVMTNPDTKEFAFDTILKETMNIFSGMYLDDLSAENRPTLNYLSLCTLKLIWELEEE